jgi:monomeric sarcosine oxidase
MKNSRKYDLVVIGAGVFGAWAAYYLRRAGRRVALIDAYGAGHSRASSGGESRLIRLGYGRDEIYTRMAQQALRLWREFDAATGAGIFHQTGVLLLAREGDARTSATALTLARVGARFERLDRAELERRYPQLECGPITWAILEPESGALLARRAVQRVAAEASRMGVDYLIEAILPPKGEDGEDGAGRLEMIATRGGEQIAAGEFVFACGPWLPRIFPELLGRYIRPTRQEVFFFGPPPGDQRFAPPQLPAWIDFGGEIYGAPDLEGRGFKIALDRHGPVIDPDRVERALTPEVLAEVRAYLAARFPALKGAPLLESRVCQYENTPHGDFLVDRHPGFENVWLLGGGSGHGFKHGPAIGEYIAARLLGTGSDADYDRRFALADEGGAARRLVY